MTQRADKFLFEKGLVKSRSAAQTLINEKKVYCGGKLIYKPSEPIPEDAELYITENPKYVSRGGLKLEAALEQFKIDVSGCVCADIGASTGGFTDCLLKHGAALVYAIEGGSGQLDESLRVDKRVISLENTNARNITKDTLGGLCDIAVMDVSFISQTLLHGRINTILKPGGVFISLIKPQFEAGKENIGKHGIADPASHGAVKEKVIKSAVSAGFEHIGTTVSPIKGGDGNIEYLAYFKKNGEI